MDMARQRTGFTLVELLVVMAIISILAALLLPALQKAVSQARISACTNSQKQIHTAFALYTDGFDGYFPPDSYWYYPDRVGGYLSIGELPASGTNAQPMLRTSCPGTGNTTCFSVLLAGHIVKRSGLAGNASVSP